MENASRHITDLGKFAKRCTRYADRYGYIPFPGDDPEEYKLDWRHSSNGDDEEYEEWFQEEGWPEHCRAAKEAYEADVQELEEWRQEECDSDDDEDSEEYQ